MTIFRSLVFYLLNDLAYLNCDVFFSELRTWLQVGKRKLDIEDETTYCDEEVLTKLVTFYKITRNNLVQWDQEFQLHSKSALKQFVWFSNSKIQVIT